MSVNIIPHGNAEATAEAFVLLGKQLPGQGVRHRPNTCTIPKAEEEDAGEGQVPLGGVHQGKRGEGAKVEGAQEEEAEGHCG